MAFVGFKIRPFDVLTKLMRLGYQKKRKEKFMYGFGSWVDRFLGILSTSLVRLGSFFGIAKSSSGFLMKTIP
jgi:hypothetical protein